MWRYLLKMYRGYFEFETNLRIKEVINQIEIISQEADTYDEISDKLKEKFGEVQFVYGKKVDKYQCTVIIYQMFE